MTIIFQITKINMKRIYVFLLIFNSYLTTIQSQPKIVPRVSYGRDAKINQWPSQVLILTGNNIGRVCGGSLITDSWVLTAAHCVRYNEDGVQHNPMKYELIIGKYNRFEQEVNEIHRSISKIVNHWKYETQNHSYDIALLKMDKPVKFNDHIKPMCLDLKGIDVTGKKCFLTGFGKTSQNGTTIASIPEKLQELQMKQFDHKKCAEIHYEFYHKERSKEAVTNQQICMVSKNKPKHSDEYSEGGGCPGDSGGPLQCLIKNHWFQIGVAWSGTDCETHPTVFNLVYQYADFIQKETKYILPSYCKT